ncbi:hypothetical protein JNUCC74_05685 [Cerasibacillus sp. JNUCC 74]
MAIIKDKSTEFELFPGKYEEEIDDPFILSIFRITVTNKPMINLYSPLKYGIAKKDIDYRNHGNPEKHPVVPHVYHWSWKKVSKVEMETTIEKEAKKMRILFNHTDSTSTDNHPFSLSDFLGAFDEDFITSHNWIFSDMEAYVQTDGEEVEDHIFYQERFCISGDKLAYYLTNSYILIVFGLVIAVKKGSVEIRKENYPKLLGNIEFWEIDYEPSITNYVIEIGFFDSSFK